MSGRALWMVGWAAAYEVVGVAIGFMAIGWPGIIVGWMAGGVIFLLAASTV